MRPLWSQATATIDADDKVAYWSNPRDFTLTDPTGGAEALAANTTGTEGTGLGYFVTGTATLSKVSDISVATQASAGLAISCRCSFGYGKNARGLGAITIGLVTPWTT